MSGFAKLYGSILDSSIWLAPDHVRLIWITLLAMADGDGNVEAAIPGIAHRARVPIDACRHALDILQSPDPESKDPDHEGRRITHVIGGFHILNYRKYRERQTPEQVKAAERQKRWREQHSVTRNEHNGTSRSVTRRNASSRRKTLKAEAEAEAEAERSSLRSDLSSSLRSEDCPPAGDPVPPVDSTKNASHSNGTRPDALKDAWNELTQPPIARCLALSGKRLVHAKRRLHEAPLDVWREVFTRIAQSAFCAGANDHAWVASFDWAIGQEDVRLKVLEGKYDNREPIDPRKAARKRARAEWAKGDS